MSDINVPLMMRKARHAILAEHYEEAALLYTTLITQEELADNFDVKIRHAFCIEKTGHAKQAIKLYQGIVAHYIKAGETGAAKSVEQTIATLENTIAKEHAAAKEEKARIKAEEKKAEIEKEAERVRLAAERKALEEKEKQAKLIAEKIKAQEETEKARLAAEKFLKAQLEIEKLRQEKAQEEARLEKIREEKIRLEKVRAKKAAAENARAERANAKKSKPPTPMEDYQTATIRMETIALSDVDEEEINVFDLSETDEAKQEKVHFDSTDRKHSSWI